MDAKPTEIDLFHILKSKQNNFYCHTDNIFFNLKSLKLCEILKSFFVVM